MQEVIAAVFCGCLSKTAFIPIYKFRIYHSELIKCGKPRLNAAADVIGSRIHMDCGKISMERFRRHRQNGGVPSAEPAE